MNLIYNVDIKYWIANLLELLVLTIINESKIATKRKKPNRFLEDP